MNQIKSENIFVKVLIFLALTFLFLFGLTLMSESLKGFGGNFIISMLGQVNSPLLGLFLGMLVTATLQSSSVTTTTIVAMVNAGMSIETAVPLILGANIGTTITSALVSFGHMSNKKEYHRAVSAATVHGFFNIITVLILFPLELLFGILSKLAVLLSNIIPLDSMYGKVGLIQFSIKPMVVFMLDFFNDSYVAGGILALFILFVSIKSMSWIFKNTIQEQVVNNKEVLDTASDLKYLGTGLGLTFLIRSSSFTTSLIVPFVASKRIKLEKAFSFIIGANVGTTFTALLAALSGNNSAALAIALVHVLFNMIGAIIFFPNTKIRYVPIYLSNKIGEWSFENRMVGVAYVSLTFFVIPLLCYLIFG